MTKLKLHIAHQVPGRVRFKIPSAKGNPELLKQISETFAVIPGIERITVNPTTGSVVLHYATDQHDEFHGGIQRHYQHAMPEGPPRTDIDEFAHKIEAEAEFLAQHSQTARAVVEFCKKLDREIKRASDNTVDLKILLALGLIGVTVFEIGASAATPVWVTLTLFAMNHFIEMHAQHLKTEPTTAPIAVKA
jgi:hypothetical protein